LNNIEFTSIFKQGESDNWFIASVLFDSKLEFLYLALKICVALRKQIIT